MGRVHDIRVRSNQFVANIGEHVEQAVMMSKDEILEANWHQMDSHLGNDGKPLIHTLTGSELLSKPYAKKTGKTKPDIYEDGSVRSEMDLIVKAKKQDRIYGIFSRHRIGKYLQKNYLNLFGISQNFRGIPRAKTVKSLGQIYKSQVFQ